jgi:putative nucleotidyltransferase with HDIG domain
LSIGELEFFRGITKDELSALTDILVGSVSKEKTIDVAGAWMRIEHIKIRHRSGMRPGKEDASRHGCDTRPVKKTVKRTAEKASEKMPVVYKAKSKMGAIVSGVLDRMEKIQTNAGRKAGRKIIELIEMEGGNATTILLLSSLRNYDEYTFLHSVNVAVITTAMSKYFGYPEETINEIGIAALMHDIGKLYVSHEIIHKTGQLTPLEWQIMKKHPVDGERILREEGVNELSRLVAYEHHMRYDLTGYPTPKDEDYNLKDASHLVRIADSYDALTTKRAYRRQIGPYEAIKLMSRSSGSEFHPRFFDSFLHVLGNIPIGSVLKLESGETVLVVDINESHGGLPRVRVLKDANGIEVEDEIILDLNELNRGPRAKRKRIAGIVDQPFRDIDIGKYLVDKK